MNYTTKQNSYGEDFAIRNHSLAMTFVPFQMNNFEDLFEPDEALCKGTIFPELYLPKLAMEVNKK